MPLELVTIPCRTDNYAFLIHDSVTGDTAVIDVPDAGPIASALDARNWRLTDILITHHHDDHIDGVDELRRAHDARVWGAKADTHRLPRLDVALEEGDKVNVGAATGTVLDVSGHTMGHIAFHFPDDRLVFTADSLMALGCGRLFEGTPEVMWQSLSKLAALPGDTTVCSGHEYTEANARFALTIEPENSELISRAEDIRSKRASGQPTVPSLLSTEIATNPFLRAGTPAVKTALGMNTATDEAVFAEIRSRKDRF